MEMIIDPYDWHRLTIAEIVRESSHAVSVRLDTMPYEFSCGQYAIVRVTMPSGAQLVRQYSFASAPSSDELWLTIVETPGGEVSTWFNKAARRGDQLELTSPLSGGFGRMPSASSLCLIGGGSGIVPLMSYLRENRLRPRYDRLTLLYSTRTDSECFQSELAVGKETIEIRRTDTAPRFSQHDIAQHCTAQDAVLLCGSRQFVDYFRQLCRQSIDDSRIYCEAFSLV